VDSRYYLDTADKSEPEALAEFDRRGKNRLAPQAHKKSASASGSWIRKSTFLGRVYLRHATMDGFASNKYAADWHAFAGNCAERQLPIVLNNIDVAGSRSRKCTNVQSRNEKSLAIG
jgi:hypothetical protein